MDSDFISNLPDDVIDQILIRLPITDAVRTCVLSTNWWYKWTTITQLVFDDRLILPSPDNNNSKDKLINFINRVLLHHSGFIHKFELSSECLTISSSMIDVWISFLSSTSIKEFKLMSFSLDGNPYKLPSCFFSAQQISTLELHGCELKPPPTFTGFSNLKSLYLNDTTFVDENGGFECLISKCPLLEKLTWGVFDSVDLNICSPNLKYLCLYGTFQDFCFEYTPLLSDVTIYSSYLSIENVVKVLSSLPNLTKFAVGIFSLELLSLSKIPEKFPFTCNRLNNLSVGLNSKDVNEICVTLCLLNSSPNLRHLEIIFCDHHLYSDTFFNSGRQDIENFWEERARIHWNMSRLQIVKITDFKGFELELEFIKLLLANSPMLEMLIIRSDELDSDRKGLEFLKELLIFPRASPKAKIKFLELHER